MRTQTGHPIPQRVFHLINLVSVVVLSLTGYMIHWPPFGNLGMDTVRWIHMAFAFLLLANLALRVYYAYFGRFADAGNFALRGTGRNLVATLKHYLFIGREPEKIGRYNGLQRVSYVAVMLLILFQGLTGFGLYWPDGYPAIAGLFGGLLALRFFHYVTMWVLVAFTIVHVYMGWTEARQEFAPMFFLDRGEPKGRQITQTGD